MPSSADETGERATAVRFTRRPLSATMMTHPGVYCLRSSETDWDEATLWRTLHVRKATRAEPPQQAIYEALGIDAAPVGIRKTLVQLVLEHAVVVPLPVFVRRK